MKKEWQNFLILSRKILCRLQKSQFCILKNIRFFQSDFTTNACSSFSDFLNSFANFEFYSSNVQWQNEKPTISWPPYIACFSFNFDVWPHQWKPFLKLNLLVLFLKASDMTYRNGRGLKTPPSLSFGSLNVGSDNFCVL